MTKARQNFQRVNGQTKPRQRHQLEKSAIQRERRRSSLGGHHVAENLGTGGRLGAQAEVAVEVAENEPPHSAARRSPRRDVDDLALAKGR